MPNKLVKYLFYLTLASAPLYLVRFSVFNIPTNVFEIMLCVSILAFISLDNKWDLKNFFKNNNLFLFGLLLIFSGLFLSLFYNKTYLPSLGIIKSWFLLPIVFSLALIALLKTEQEKNKIFFSIYLSTFLISCISLVYKSLGLTSFDNRLSGIYLSPNHLAMFLAPGIIIGFFHLNKKLENTTISKMFSDYKNVFWVLSLLSILLSFYFTYSYGSWIAIALSFSVLFLFTHPKKILLAAGIFGLLLFLQIGNVKLNTLATMQERSSLSSRIMIWKSAFKMLSDNPFVGIGAGNFQNTYLSYQKYFPPYLEWAVPQPHNIFLAFWLQSGLLGLIGFCLIIFLILRSLFLTIQKKLADTVAISLLGFFFYTLLHGIIDTPFWKNDLAFLFWVFCFLTIKGYSSKENKFKD